MQQRSKLKKNHPTKETSSVHLKTLQLVSPPIAYRPYVSANHAKGLQNVCKLSVQIF